MAFFGAGGVFCSDVQDGYAGLEGVALFHGLRTLVINAMEVGDDRALDVSEVGSLPDLCDGGLVGPVDRETGFAEVGLRIVFGFLEQFEALVLQINLVDVSGSSVKPLAGFRPARKDREGGEGKDQDGGVHVLERAAFYCSRKDARKSTRTD